MLDPRFLTLEQCVRLHSRMLARFGGSRGIRSRELLESAVGAPQAVMFGRYFHESIPEMAAALAFSLVSNHPFVDGNKRVGLLASAVFLRRNGYRLRTTSAEVEDLFLRLAAGEVTKDEVISGYESHSQRFDERA